MVLGLHLHSGARGVARILSFCTLLAALLILSENLPGQTDAAATDGGGTNKFTLSGTVVNSVTGQPVPRAMVQIYIGGQRSGLTNAEGHFEFTGLSAGQTGVNVQKPGFFSPDQVRPNGWVPPVAVTVGPDTSAVVVKLVPGSVIAGHITSNGEPVEGVPVKVIAADIVEGRKQWIQPGASVSDEEGEFRIPNLPSGEYFLEVGPKWEPGGARTAKGPESGYGRVFYPSAPAMESATPLTLAVGQRTELELSLKPEPWYRISGTVKLAEASGNWNVQLVDESGMQGAPSRNNAETGEFETKAPAGNYMLRAQQFGAGGVIASADVPLTVNSDVTGLQVAMGPGTSIPIRVKTEGTGKPAAEPSGNQMVERMGPNQMVMRMGERMPKDSRMPPMSMWLRRSGFSEGGGPAARMDQTGKPETLAVRDIEPGSYWVEINRNAPWYVQSAECGNIDLLRETLTVTSGPPCAEIDVVLRDDGATLKVNATWEGEPGQAIVILLPERAPQQAMISEVSNGGETDGELAPGAYSVLLVDHADGIEYKNPEAMSGYLSKASHVTLGPNQKASVSVELVRVGR